MNPVSSLNNPSLSFLSLFFLHFEYLIVHAFKKLVQNTGFILYAVQYILEVYFTHNSLPLLIPYPFIVPSPLVTTNLYILYICESVPFFFFPVIITSLLHF